MNPFFTSIAITVAWQLVCMVAALSGAALGFTLYNIKLPQTRLLLLPLLLPATELLRSLLIALICYGEGGSITPNFNLGSLALTSANTPLIYSSRLVGFVGLGVLVVLINLALYFLLTEKRVVLTVATLAVIGTITYVGWQQGRMQPDQSKHVVMIHLSEKDALDRPGIADQLPDNIDLLVLPEYSDLQRSPELKAITTKLSPTGLAITSKTEGLSPNAYDNLVALNNRGEVVSEQSKRFMIPTGEYMPYSLIGAFKAIGQGHKLTEFNTTQKVIPGSKDETTIEYEGQSFGALVCSGVLSLDEYARLSEQGADVLINTASLSFLATNSRYNVLGQRAARFQAVSNNRPLIQASRSSRSYALNNQGQVLSAKHGHDTTIIETYVRY